MEFLLQNWFLIVCGLAVLVGALTYIIGFAKKPTSEQIKNIKEWLYLAVLNAEKEFGDGMGKIQLKAVYEKAVSLFPWVGFFPYSKFEELVALALASVKEDLKTEGTAAYTYMHKID